MDPQKRTELIATIRRQRWDDGGPAPVVSLEEFFTGNDDLGSIGCNLGSDHPGIAAFFEVLRRVRDLPEVTDVLVEIYEVEEADPTMWPFSERIYVLTRTELDSVEGWLEPLQPSEVSEGWFLGRPEVVADLAPGTRAVAAWWD